MIGVLEELPELVYIADIDTYELLFVNRAGREAFGIQGEGVGTKCYEAFHKKTEPCEFCTNHLLTAEEYYVWKIKNTITGRHYVLKDRLVEWNGKLSRLEIAFDMTEIEERTQELMVVIETESIITECIKLLSICDNLPETLDRILKRIGTYLEAERAYIFELYGNTMSNTYEWCAENVVPEIQMLQNMDIELVSPWLPYFDRNECVIIENLEDCKESDPELYQVLKCQDIRSLVIAPLKMDNRLIGYIGVDNPPAGKIHNISDPLNTLGYFIISTMQRIKDKQLLEKLSYKDMLTGALNRNAYILTLEKLSALRDKMVGIIYLDVNGLKECNDKYGHKKGDCVLMEIVNNINAVFDNRDVFRIGGDEFVVIAVGLEKKELERKALLLAELTSGKEEYSLSIGYRWADSCGEIEQLIMEADNMMYSNKKRYYREKRHSRSHVYGDAEHDESGEN